MTMSSLDADPFMDKIVLTLIPFFAASAASPQDIRTAILKAVASYGARTEAEMAEAAQILALGFSTLECLAEASANGTSQATRLRLRGNANALGRTKKQCQQALADSMSVEVPQDTESPLISGEPEADLGAAIHHARVMADHARRRIAASASSRERTETSADALPPTPAPAPPETQPAPAVQETQPAPAAQESHPPTAPRGRDAGPAVQGKTASLTPQEKNKVLWASVMSQMIGDILPNTDPPSA